MSRLRELSRGKLATSVVRLLRGDKAHQMSSIDQETAHVIRPTDADNDYQRDRSFLLNAECRKAEALMEFQKRHLAT